jgi:small subunit ribosomal protein S15e
LLALQADDEIDEAAAMELKKKRTFRKFTYRGIDLDNLLDLTPEQLIDLVHARARRRLHRGLKKKGMALLKKVRSSTST